MSYFNKMRIFTIPRQQIGIKINKKEMSIEEQEKELLYWESQYEQLFDKIEKKNKDKFKKRQMYNNMFSINLQINYNKQ